MHYGNSGRVESKKLSLAITIFCFRFKFPFIIGVRKTVRIQIILETILNSFDQLKYVLIHFYIYFCMGNIKNWAM